MRRRDGDRPSEKLTVTTTRGPRGLGAYALHSYGYAELGLLLGVKPVKVALAVAAEDIEPLSLIELVAVRKHGFDWARNRDPALTAYLQRKRPPRQTRTCSVNPPVAERPYGLADLWAVTSRDVAEQLGIQQDRVWNDGRVAQRTTTPIDMRDLGSVLDYVQSHLHPRTIDRLGLARE